MKNWVIGVAVVIIALAALYGAAASSRAAPDVAWIFLAVFAAIAASGIFLAGRAASRAGPPPEFVDRPGRGQRTELPDATPGPDPWAGTGRTLGVMAIALVGLLLHLAAFVAAFYFEVGWVVYPALALTVALLVIIVIFAAPRDV